MASEVYNTTAYCSLAVGTLAFALFAGLRPIVETRVSGFWAKMSPTWVFLAAAAGALVAWRWPSTLLNRELNPDESMLIALAHVASIRHVPWRDFDATTSGPINVWPLALGHSLGFGYTYGAARATAVLLLLVAVFALYRTMARLFGEAAARLSSLCAICVFATSSYDLDFAHYSSEMAPVSLIALFGLLGAELAVDPTYRSILYSGFAGALAAAIPLAKLQAAPIDAALVAIIIGLILCKPLTLSNKAIAVGAFVTGAFVIFSAVLLPVALSGALKDFAISYVREPLWYVHEASLPLPLRRGPIDIATLPSFLFLTMLSTTLLGILIVLSLQIRRSVNCKAVAASMFAPYAAILLVLAASTYAVFVANEPYAHHLLFLVLPICATLGATFAIMTTVSHRADLGRASAAATVVMLIALCTFSSLPRGYRLLEGFRDTRTTTRSYLPTSIGTPSEIALINRIPQGASLATWGWEPEVYVLRGAIAGTREAYTQFQMWPGPFQAYYLNRYVEDLKRNKPDYFFDAARPLTGQDWSMPPQYELANFKQVAHYISKHYALLAETNGLRLYRSLCYDDPGGAPRNTRLLADC